MSTARVIVPLVSCLLGGVVGWTLHPCSNAPPPSRAVAVEAAPAAADAPIAKLEQAQLAMMLRAIVREELGRLVVDRPAPVVASAPERPRAEPLPLTSEQTAAVASAQQILEGARRAGRWTDDDRESFRSAVLQADDASRMQLRLALVAAINRQELKLDGPPPF